MGRFGLCRASAPRSKLRARQPKIDVQSLRMGAPSRFRTYSTFFLARHLVEGAGWRDIDPPGTDQLRHVPEEERQQERANVRAVHVRPSGSMMTILTVSGVFLSV